MMICQKRGISFFFFKRKGSTNQKNHFDRKKIQIGNVASKTVNVIRTIKIILFLENDKLCNKKLIKIF